jgi:hypothetical protein
MGDSLKAVAPVLAVVVVGFAVAGLALAGLGILSGSAKEMEMLEERATVLDLDAPVPAMDAASPNEIQTATFALG